MSSYYGFFRHTDFDRVYASDELNHFFANLLFGARGFEIQNEADDEAMIDNLISQPLYTGPLVLSQGSAADADQFIITDGEREVSVDKSGYLVLGWTTGELTIEDTADSDGYTLGEIEMKGTAYYTVRLYHIPTQTTGGYMAYWI